MSSRYAHRYAHACTRARHSDRSRQVLAQRNPRYLLRIVNRHEEFYALIMLYVEQHYLRTRGTHPSSMSRRTAH